MDDRFGLNFFGVDLIIGKLLYLLSNLFSFVSVMFVLINKL